MKQLIAALCAGFAFDIKGDPIIGAFARFSAADSAGEYLACYGLICRTLLSQNKSLSQYLHDLLMYGEHEFIAKAAAAPAAEQVRAVEFDIAAVKELSQYGADRLKTIMSGRCDERLIASLPDYQRGEFNYTAQYFLDYAACHGQGSLARFRAFTFEGGKLCPIEETDPIRLCDLKSYEAQRAQVVENTYCFVNGKAAQDVLLYGDRGTGKSSTVKALLNEYENLRLVELKKSDIPLLPALFSVLRKSPLRFIVMIDDLTFAEDDDRYGVLKAALEGSAAARPENVLIYATTNRRRIIKDAAGEQLGDNGANADAVDESMSLSDRFGLFVTFSRPTREVYLDIVEKLAAESGITLERQQLFAAAERYALRKNGRSPRTARRFVEYISARLELGLEY